jgi:membrane protein required for colicin V production
VSPLDALLLVLLVPFALRGWWRGFCRETLALAGVLCGVLAAAATGPRVAAILVEQRLLSESLALPVAWAGIVLGTCLVAAIIGRIADWLVRALLLGGVNRVAGALFGGLKGAAFLGFGLLLAEHAAPSSGLTRAIATSRLARPLEQIANSVVAHGRDLGPMHTERRA